MPSPAYRPELEQEACVQRRARDSVNYYAFYSAELLPGLDFSGTFLHCMRSNDILFNTGPDVSEFF